MANERRLIDADELEDKLYDNEFSILCPLDEVTGVIDCCTTVDAVEVVRCKDCVFYRSATGFCHYHSKEYDGGECWDKFGSDDFCSRGERMCDNG